MADPLDAVLHPILHNPTGRCSVPMLRDAVRAHIAAVLDAEEEEENWTAVRAERFARLRAALLGTEDEMIRRFGTTHIAANYINYISKDEAIRLLREVDLEGQIAAAIAAERAKWTAPDYDSVYVRGATDALDNLRATLLGTEEMDGG